MDHKTLSSYPGRNCLKVAIPKFGTRLKVYSKLFVNSCNMNNVILRVMLLCPWMMIYGQDSSQKGEL